jgi:hypothetical protein
MHYVVACLHVTPTPPSYLCCWVHLCSFFLMICTHAHFARTHTQIMKTEHSHFLTTPTYCPCFGASTALTRKHEAHAEACNARMHSAESASRDYSYLVIRRTHIVLHFLRCFMIFVRCVLLRSQLRKRLQVRRHRAIHTYTHTRHRTVCVYNIHDIFAIYIFV